MYEFKKKLIYLTRLFGWLAQAPIRRNLKNGKVYSKKGKHWFVGYYDINCLRNGILYFHEVDNYLKSSPKECNIIALNINTGVIDTISKSRAVNWQIGARLNIVEDEIVFNDVVDNQLVHRAINCNSGKSEIYPVPYWLKNKKQDLTITIDFQRLWSERPGYGYYGEMRDNFKNSITILNYNCTKKIVSLSLKRIIQELNLSKGGYLNHLIANFDASIIITTYNLNEGSSRRVVPVVYDVVLDKVSSFDPGLTFSHPSFIDTQTIGYFDGDGYVSRNLQSGERKSIYITKRDGHPTFVNGTEFLTDSYPDKFSQMEVYFYKSGKKQTLFRHVNPPWYVGDNRCDLHPRVFNDKLIVDVSLFNGRAIQVIDFEK